MIVTMRPMLTMPVIVDDVVGVVAVRNRFVPAAFAVTMTLVVTFATVLCAALSLSLLCHAGSYTQGSVGPAYTFV